MYGQLCVVDSQLCVVDGQLWGDICTSGLLVFLVLSYGCYDVFPIAPLVLWSDHGLLRTE